MENDIVGIPEMCKILNKTPTVVRRLCREKKIPCTFLAGSYYSSKTALSLFISGCNIQDFYEKMTEKMLNESLKLII